MGRIGEVGDGSQTFTYGYEANRLGLVKTITGPNHTVANTFEDFRDVLVSKETRLAPRRFRNTAIP